MQNVLGVDWDTANYDFPPGNVTDASLPPPPPSPRFYSIQSFDEELGRMYSMMQNYSTALQHLTLGRILHGNEGRGFTTKISHANHNLELLMNKLKSAILRRNKTPNNHNTQMNMEKIYTEVGPDRNRRDFAILRDIRNALTHLLEVFQNIC